MSAPCCPGHEGGRGWPYTPHWFCWHDADAGIDTHATHERDGIPRTDLGCVSSVIAMFESTGRPLMYGKETDRWYLWDGSGRYSSRDSVFGIKLAENVALLLYTALSDAWSVVEHEIAMLPAAERDRAMKIAAENWKPVKSYVSRIWNNTGQRGLRSQLMDSMAVDESRLDTGTGQIIVDNGVISYDQIARTGLVPVAPHDYRMLVTRRTGDGLRWEPDARCPAFEMFMRQSVPDADQRFWLLWRTVNALFGRQPRKGFVNLIGIKDSGKSTYTDLIAYLGGDYARTVPIETFLTKHAGDSGFRQAELRGGRFVYAQEPAPGGRYDVGLMKTLTGNDRQRTAGKWEKPVEWQPQLTAFIGSNGPVRFGTDDTAMVDRLEAVLFRPGYTEMDTGLLTRLKAERNGILRMLIDTVRWEHEHGVPKLPGSIVELREAMATDTEDALEFVAEMISDGRLRADPAVPAYKCTTVQQLYEQYKVWSAEAGNRPVGRKTFSKVIGRRYSTKPTDGRIRFTGLSWS